MHQQILRPHPLYSHMIIIKSETGNQLSQSSLNAVLRICMFSMPLAKFSQTYVEDCVTYWCNAKECRLGQQKRKKYSKRKLTLKKHKTFDILSFCLKVQVKVLKVIVYLVKQIMNFGSFINF